MSAAVTKGMRFVWASDGDWLSAVSVQVATVARDGSWANLKCTGPAGRTWGKRMGLPLPETFRPVTE